METKSKVDARFRFAPKGSQVLVVLFGAICGTGALATIAMSFLPLTAQILIPAAICVGFAALACFCWLKSHHNVDMIDAEPTVISNSPTGITVSTDSRAAADPRVLAAV